MSFKKGEEIHAFSDRIKTRKFLSSKLRLKELLKKGLRPKVNNTRRTLGIKT